MSNRLLALALALSVVPALAETLATQPAGEPAYAPGLAVTVFKLARAPDDIVKIAAGRAPDLFWTLQTLRMLDRDFHGQQTNFQASISGEFFAAAGGDYQFDVVSDDGLDLKLDGVTVVSDRWVNGVARHSYATAVLDQGWHPIHIDYYQSDRAMGFYIRMKPPGAMDFVDVPPASLRVRQSLVDAANDAIGKGDDDAAARPWRQNLFKSKGFGGLTETEAAIAKEMLEGPTDVSKAAREEWRKLCESTHYEKLSESQQTMVVSGFLHGWLYYGTSRPQPTTRAVFTLSEPERLEHFQGWAGADRHGVKYVLTIDDRNLDIFMPLAGVDESTNVPKALAGLPHYLRRLVQRIQVEPYGTASELEAGGGVIWIRQMGPASLQSLDSNFVHEAGHLLMNETDCGRPYEAAVSREVLSVSQYARHNAHEDFAELLRLYVTAGDDADQLRSLRTLFPYRMKVLEAAVKKAGGPG